MDFTASSSIVSLPADVSENRTALPSSEGDVMRGWKALTDAVTFPEQPNSERSQQYLKLVGAVRRMALLPSIHDLHLDRGTAERAEIVLSMLLQNFETQPPKIFPHEGDTLVLTWDAGPIKRLFSVEGGDLELVDMNKKTKVRCRHDLSFDKPEDVREWIFALGGAPSSRTIR